MQLRRSTLVTPGSSPDMIASAAATEADEVVLDLEDAVAESRKAEAREHILSAVDDHDWTGKRLGVRINEPSSQYAYRDVVDLVEAAGTEIDTLVVPKVTAAEDLVLLDTLLSQIEAAVGLEDPVELEPMIEHVLAVERADAIAAASDRNAALLFGNHDYALTIKGAVPVARPNDAVGQYDEALWDYLGVRVVQAANTVGLDAITTVGDDDFTDLDRFASEIDHAKGLGFVGGWAIHPNQLPVLNLVFAPNAADVEWATTVIDAFEDAIADGEAAVGVDGTMVTVVHYRNAERILEYADAIDGIESS